MSDQELLRRFVAGGSETAFAKLEVAAVSYRIVESRDETRVDGTPDLYRARGRGDSFLRVGFSVVGGIRAGFVAIRGLLMIARALAPTS